MMIRWVFIGLLWSLLSGCTPPPSEPVVRFGLASAPVTLDPRFATDATSARIIRLLYRALVDFDEQFQPIPDLARWQQKSLTHYRFFLTDKHHAFHHGVKLTAQDVKATYDFILKPENASPHYSSLAQIDKIQIIDPYTIDFLLKKPDAIFPGRLVVGILPTDLINQQHPFNKQPIGSGPFEWLTWPQAGELWLRRRQDGQRIVFLTIPDPVVRALKLARHEIDLLQNDLSPELVNWLAQQPGIIEQKHRGTNFAYLGFNLMDPVTQQLPIRQAIAYAINRQEIIDYVLGHAARPANSFLLPENHWASPQQLPTYAYAPQKAKALLKEAGYSNSY